MRLKTLTAPDMAQAMEMLRREIGPDAIIVSTETMDGGVQIVAASEDGDDKLGFPEEATSIPVNDDPIDVVHEALLRHGVPNPLLDRLVDASFAVGADEALPALTGALRATFEFRPIVERGPNQPLILVGIPGAGKTVTAAKLAARAVLSGRKVRLITTDLVRAGAVDQLDAFARLLGTPLDHADTDRRLSELVASAAPNEQVLIDTAGVNPYSTRDMAELGSLLRSVTAEPILVIAAGGDAAEAQDQTRAFASLGIARLLVTRLDMVHRLGSLLAAADAGRLAFSDYGMSPSVAGGLAPIDPSHLARMLLPEPMPAALPQPATRGHLS